MSRSFFDTNVLLYMYDDDEPQKKAGAIEAFERAVEENRVVLSTQVLQEFYVNATRKLARPLSQERAAARVRDFLLLPLVRVDGAMILAAIERSRSMSLSFWDALVVEAAPFAEDGRREGEPAILVVLSLMTRCGAGRGDGRLLLRPLRYQPAEGPALLAAASTSPAWVSGETSG
ncbi:PIN domain-containing protein [Rubrobacter taiwanensis]|uniref:PIN domain-containing protein n=1 Tax=Rubrobacter taiwanensis TaxID=185139 RepID=A0A4R1BGU7_9ACTN|nr:PIN domain-containing protein [Rubrobacter taiwanensis]TCJ16429.1 PIN domain-containing protein [Rubrobacter taiwanensis]